MAVLWNLLLCCAIAFAGVASGGEHHSASSELVMMSAAMNSGCKGTVGECLAGGDEFELLRSESERRILFARRYISYGALQRDAVPCSRRGASYYNCRPGAQANPYVRGCSAITRCRW